MTDKNLNTLLIGIIAVLAFGTGIWLGNRGQQTPDAIIVQDRVITVLPKPVGLKPFHLVTADQHAFTVDSLKNKYSLLFFGYTFCPDICPTTLQELGQLYSQLKRKNKHQDIQVVFVSVDPKRDKPEVLKKYVAYFNKDFIGVTGDANEIHNLARQLSASYEVLDDGKTENYAVNHTGLIFVTNPDARYTAILSPPHQPDLIESRLDLLRQLDE